MMKRKVRSPAAQPTSFTVEQVEAAIRVVKAKHPMEFKEIIRRHALYVSAKLSIVELGTFHGAGTIEIASANPRSPIYTYDWFKNVDYETVRRTLNPFTNVHVMWADIRDVGFEGPPIGLLVDDASKSFFPETFEHWEPHLVDGATLVLQDFYEDCPNLQGYVLGRGWPQIDGWAAKDGCAVFLYRKPRGKADDN